MKFIDLLKKYNWEDIKPILLALYPDQKKNIDGYVVTLKELLVLKPVKTKMRIIIEDGFDEDKERYYNVSAKDGTIEETAWAIDFMDWAECLGMEIDSETLSVYSPLDIVAHCLWEMTWHGFTQKEIKKKGNELFEAVKIAKKEIEGKK